MAFEVADDGFRLDGQPFRVLSGSLHYFRVHPDHWADRIIKARQLGLNTIDTYVPWNFHSEREGEFRLDGWRDLGGFLDLVAEHGLNVIVRPGPYICAEWRNAGLPTWLTAKKGIRVRTSDPQYMEATAAFYAQALPLVADRQVTRGGNVLMVQVENEYGAFGDDKDYLRSLVGLIRAQGIDVPLFTCDQANDEMLSRGGLPELLRTGTFGSRSKERLEILRRHQPTGPLMCAEFWNGWFDSWGGHHHTTVAADSAAELDQLLAAGGSVNLYMLHGGTNFALTNGANDKGVYVPIATSYDYDAPLREDGTPSPKYFELREVLSRYTTVPDETPSGFEPAPSFSVPLQQVAVSMEEVLTGPVEFHDVPDMDEVAPDARFSVYTAEIQPDDGVVVFREVRDRVICLFNGRRIATLQRSQHERAVVLPDGEAGTLQLIVEDLGRVNYGSCIGEAKGLIGPAVTQVRTVTGWKVEVLDHERLRLQALSQTARPLPEESPVRGLTLMTGSFTAPAGSDLFLDTSQFGTGLVWVNDLLLGRYWSAGPTSTMYVPGPVVTSGDNTIVVWELNGADRPVAEFVDGPRLGHTEA
ncbi:glycoside hydrolase family 35 protein [Tessaracoccus sp. Y36]